MSHNVSCTTLIDKKNLDVIRPNDHTDKKPQQK